MYGDISNDECWRKFDTIFIFFYSYRQEPTYLSAKTKNNSISVILSKHCQHCLNITSK